MRLAVLSDIHIDSYPEPETLLQGVIDSLRESGADALILAGDLSSDYVRTLEALHRIDEALPKGCIYVPGNHDIWNQHHPGLSSWDIYHRLMAFPGNLARGPREIGNRWTVVGDMGWYDYTLGSPEFSVEEFDRMEHRGRVWQDRVFAQWGAPTLAVHRHFYTKIESQLNQLPWNRQIILVTHVIPVADFSVPFRPNLWNYLNAFMGGSSYGELAIQAGVKISISGHVHFRRETVHRGTRFICNCLGYRYQWRSGRAPSIEVPNALIYLEIE